MIIPGASNNFFGAATDAAAVRNDMPDNPAAPISDTEPIIKLLKETTEMLRDQLRVKDGQIKNLDEKIGQLIERNRETNILLKGLQDKMVLLEKPKADIKEDSAQQAAKEEIVPSAAPLPGIKQNPAPAVKVKVAYSDSVPLVESEDDASNDSNNNGGDWQEAPGGNERRSGHGFFDKMFR